MRVVALSGGYSRAEADALLAQNTGLIASFSRALTEGLSAGQSDEEFNATLDRAIQSIYELQPRVIGDRCHTSRLECGSCGWTEWRGAAWFGLCCGLPFAWGW